MPNFKNAYSDPTVSNLKVQAVAIQIRRNGVSVFTDLGQNQSTMDHIQQVKSQAAIDHIVDANTPNLVSLNISGGTDVDVHKASITFAIPTAYQPPNSNRTSITQLTSLDFADEKLRWTLMDHIEVWISPNVNTHPFTRSFVGVVTGLTFEISENIYNYTLQVSDILFWLDRARVQTQYSLVDFALRRKGLLTANEANVKTGANSMLIHKNRYMGLTVKHLAEKILFNHTIPDIKIYEENGTIKKQYQNPDGSLNTAAVRKDTNQLDKSMLVPNYNELEVDDMLAISTYGGADFMILINAQGKALNDIFIKYADLKPFRQQIIDQIKNGKEPIIADSMVNGKNADVQAAIQKVNKELASITNIKDPNSLNIVTELTNGGVIANQLDYLSITAAQKRGSEAILAYWEIAFYSYLQENYKSYMREEDKILFPFPTEFTQPLVMEGTYSTKLDLLRQLAQQTTYEIFQSPQGFIFIKPPFYNALPVKTIEAVEISNISRVEDISNILTSATTEGVFVLQAPQGTASEREGQLLKTMESGPFLIANYQVTFPRGYVDSKNTKKIFNFGVTNTDTIGTSGIGEIANSGAIQHVITSIDDYTTILKTYKSRGAAKAQGIASEGLSITIKDPIESNKNSIDLTAGSSDNYLQLSNILLYLGLKNAMHPDKIASLPWDRTQSSEFTSRDFGNDPDQTDAYLPVNSYFKLLFGPIRDLQMPTFGGKLSDSQIQAISQQVRSDFNDLYKAQIVKYPSLNTSTVAITHAVTSRISGMENAVRDYINTKLYTVIKESASKNSEFTNSLFIPDDRLNVVFKNTEDNLIRKSTTPVFVPAAATIFASCRYEVDLGYLSLISTGKYNIMQHGQKDARFNNTLVRTPTQAALFSKYMLYRHNASAETFTIQLQTLRPDITPGFVILNTTDLCAYYVQSLQHSITAGTDAHTTLNCICRRRPVFYKLGSLLEGIAIDQKMQDPSQYLKMLTTWEENSNGENPIFIAGLEVSANPSYAFLGWEMWGPNDNDLGQAYTNAQGIYMPPFGGYFSSNASDSTSISGTKKVSSTIAKIDAVTFISIMPTPSTIPPTTSVTFSRLGLDSASQQMLNNGGFTVWTNAALGFAAGGAIIVGSIIAAPVVVAAVAGAAGVALTGAVAAGSAGVAGTLIGGALENHFGPLIDAATTSPQKWLDQIGERPLAGAWVKVLPSDQNLVDINKLKPLKNYGTDMVFIKGESKAIQKGVIYKVKGTSGFIQDQELDFGVDKTSGTLEVYSPGFLKTVLLKNTVYSLNSSNDNLSNAIAQEKMQVDAFVAAHKRGTDKLTAAGVAFTWVKS